MKKILGYTLPFLALLFVACEPMEDIHKDVDKEIEAERTKAEYLSQFEMAPEAYELTDEDYALSSNEDVAKYKNFSDYALPKDYLPEILNKKFTGEDGAEMKVTYNFYKKPFKDEDNAHVISEEEYALMGKKSDFGDEDEAEYALGKLFDEQAKYVEIEAGTEKTAMYVLFQKNQDRYIKVNADFTTEVLKYEGDDSYILTGADYESVGNGKYKNFYNIEEAQEKIAEFAKASGKGAGNYTGFVYKNYFDTYVVFRHSGVNWNVAQSLSAVTEPLNYKIEEDYKNSYWWADPAIKITLTEADYLSDDETSKYKNVDLRDDSAYADAEVRAAGFGAMLELNHGPIIDDQQYLVSYVYYDGTRGVASDRIIRKDGVWQQYVEE